MVRQLRNRLIITEEDTITDVDAGKYNVVSSPVTSLNVQTNHGIKMDCDDNTTSRDHTSPINKVYHQIISSNFHRDGVKIETGVYTNSTVQASRTNNVSHQIISSNIQKDGVKMETDDCTTCTFHASPTNKVIHGTISRNIHENGVKMETDDYTTCTIHASPTNKASRGTISRNIRKNGVQMETEDNTIFKIHSTLTNEYSYQVFSTDKQEEDGASGSASYENLHQINLHNILEEAGGNIENNGNNITEACVSPSNETSPQRISSNIQKNGRNVGTDNNSITEAYSNTVSENQNVLQQKARSKKKRHLGFSGIGPVKTYNLRLRKELLPKMQIHHRTFSELDDFASSLMDTFDKDLRMLLRKGEKTLGVKHVETVTKLCLPKSLRDSAITYARSAVDKFVLNTRNKN